MKVAAILGKKQAGLVDKPDPKPKDEFVVVKIHAAPMCTEFHMYEEGGVSDTLGHEAAGEVAFVDRSDRVKVGDRVVVQPQYPCGRCYLCREGNYIHCLNTRQPLEITGSEAGTATYAQYVIKTDWLLTPIPEGMPYDHAAMACCGLGPTFGAMQLMNAGAFDTVLITGMGPVGLGGVINARHRNARVIAVESHPFRQELARRLGAEAVVDPKGATAVQQVLDLTGGIGADKSIDTSGVAAAKPFLVKATRRKGHIAFVGWSGQVEVNEILSKGLTLHGAWHYNLNDAPKLMHMIAAVRDRLDILITHKFPLSRVQEAWELQLTGHCGKVVLHPWE